MTKKQLSLLAGFISAFVLYSALCIPASAQAPTTVKIGLIYPLTGAMASFGEDMARAVPLLEKKFNEQQSKYKFELLLEDGKFGQTNAAITAAKKLVDVDGVRFLAVGSSGEILQIASFVESSHVLAVAGFASHPDVKNAGDYVFRTYIDAEVGIRAVVEDMQKKGFSRIGVISEESSFTSAIQNALANLLGDKLVLSEDYGLGDADLRTLVAKIRSKNLDALYLNTTTPANFITLFKQLRSNKVRAPFYTYYVPTLKDVQDSLGQSLNGTLYLDFPQVSSASGDFEAFLSELVHSDDKPVRALFNFRTNYNAIKVIFDGIMSVGPNPKRVKDYLYTYDQPSATGHLRFDKNGDAKELTLALKTYHTNS